MILDNLCLLDCYLKTNYLTLYLDNLDNYIISSPNLFLPQGLWSKSKVSDRWLRLIIYHPSHNLLALSSLYLLLRLDKAEDRYLYLTKVLSVDMKRLRAIRTTVVHYKLRSILRPSLPWKGRRHKGGYPRSGSGL